MFCLSAPVKNTEDFIDNSNVPCVKNSILPPENSGDFAEFANFDAFQTNCGDTITNSSNCKNNTSSDDKGGDRPESIVMDASGSVTQSVRIDTNGETQRLSNGDLTDSGVYSSNVSPIQQSDQIVPEVKHKPDNSDVFVSETDHPDVPIQCENSEDLPKEICDDTDDLIDNSDSRIDLPKVEETPETHTSTSDNDTQDLKSDKCGLDVEQDVQSDQKDETNENCDKNLSRNDIPSPSIPESIVTDPKEITENESIEETVPSSQEVKSESDQTVNDGIETEKTNSEISETKGVMDENQVVEDSTINSDSKHLEQGDESAEHNIEKSAVNLECNSSEIHKADACSDPVEREDTTSVNDVNEKVDNENSGNAEGSENEVDLVQEEKSDSGVEPSDDELNDSSLNLEPNCEGKELPEDATESKQNSHNVDITEMSGKEQDSFENFKDSSTHSKETGDSPDVESKETSEEGDKEEEDDFGDFGGFNEESNFEQTAEDCNASFNATNDASETKSDEWSAFPDTNVASSGLKSENDTEGDWAAFSSPAVETNNTLGPKDDENDDWAECSGPQTIETPEGGTGSNVNNDYVEDDDGDWGDFGDDDNLVTEPVETTSPVATKSESEKLSTTQLQSMVSLEIDLSLCFSFLC